jgi:hypothetical protein
VRGDLSAASRLPLFALAVLAAAAVLSLLWLLDRSPQAPQPGRPSPAAPRPLVLGGSASPAPATTHAPLAAVVVGRRFLRLYACLQTESLDARAAHRLRSFTSLALAGTLLAQPPRSAGGGRARAALARVRVERLSSSAVLLHAAVRRAGALLQVRCLVQRDQSRWTVTALTAAA